MEEAPGSDDGLRPAAGEPREGHSELPLDDADADMRPLDVAEFADAAFAELEALAPPGFVEGPGRAEVPIDLGEWGDTPAEGLEKWLFGRLSGLQDDVALETSEPWPSSSQARRQPQPFVRVEDGGLHWGFELDGEVVLALRSLSVANLRFGENRC